MTLQITGDTHTHTVACGHAMGTVTENLAHAARLGHRFLTITEHTGSTPWSAHPWFFNNLIRMPRVVDGVVLLKGCEVNVLNAEGDLDLQPSLLNALDLVVASAHMESYVGSRERSDYTDLYLALAQNPLVDIIGHCGDPRFPHDLDRAVRAYRDHGKIVELNSGSVLSRKGSQPLCREVAQLCKRYGVPVVLSSDAHCPQHVGRVDDSAALAEEVEIPAEQVLNTNYGRFRAAMKTRKGLQLPE